jgi:hypothetical protein
MGSCRVVRSSPDSHKTIPSSSAGMTPSVAPPAPTGPSDDTGGCHIRIVPSSLHDANIRLDATGFQATALTVSSCPLSTSMGLEELDCQT